MKIKYKIFFLSLSISFSVFGCAAIGKMVADSLTENTNSIKNLALKAYYVNNLYPTETNTTSLDYSGSNWKEGKSAVTISLLKKTGLGLYKLNGEILVNGDPVKYIGAGSYTKYLDEFENKPQIVTIKSKSGEESSITIDPPKSVKLLSINGEKENPEIDLSSDLELEFDNFNNLEKDEKIKVSLLMDVLGVREFVDIGIFKPVKKLKIPNAALKNLSVTASASGVAEINSGKNFLRVERYKVKKEKPLIIPVSQSVSMSWSTMPVILKGKTIQNRGIKIEGFSKNTQDGLRYNFFKPNAFYGKPFSKAKKLALTSLSVRGSLRHVESFSNDKTVGGITTTTTTKIVRQFPNLPNAFWDQLLNNVYKDLIKVLKENNIELIPVEKTLQAKEYKFLSTIDEENNIYKISKTYKGLKSLMPTFDTIIKQLSATIPTDRAEIKLLNELNVDGLIGLSFDVNIDPKSEKIILNPILSVKITGGANGYTVGPVEYMSGSIIGNGSPFSEKELSNINALNKIIKKDQIMSLFKNSIKEMKKQEKEFGYDAIWDLQ
ncbi:MAG: hypothetical protein AABZ74_12090 [Cyanobacteriota bacterium]